MAAQSGKWWWLASLLVVLNLTDRVESQVGNEPTPSAPTPTSSPTSAPAYSSAEMAAAMQEWIKLSQPGEPHQLLEKLVGEWTTETRVWMAGPQSEPTISPGKSTIKWILGKRFVQELHQGQMMGMPFTGMGLIGHDNYKNMYVMNWVDTMGTSMFTAKGAGEPHGKLLTFYGEMDEASLHVQDRMVKMVRRFVDQDHHVLEWYDLHASDDYKVMEIRYTRQ
ncbi:MAG: hypothetical protein HJJLKODD_00180 [Phycisphaerae bacterium]|nr:hypothetical protein [Phycisphaerae bacterium]